MASLETAKKISDVALAAATVGGTYVDMQNSFGLKEQMLHDVGPIASYVGDVPIGMAIFAAGLITSQFLQTKMGFTERGANISGAVVIGTLFAVALWAELNFTQFGEFKYTADLFDIPGLILGVAGTRALVNLLSPKAHRYYL